MGEVIWKAYRLGDLFEFNSSNQLSLNKKALDISDIKIDDYKIALVTQSEKNNGISGYIKETEEISKKKMKNFITYSMHFGLCYYHDYDFVLMDTHGSVFRLLPKIQTLSSILENRKDINYFISFIIKKVCHSDLFSYGYLPNSSRASREIILLPCLEVTKDDDYIWEENGHYYTLAVEYIEHLMNEAKELREQKTIHLYEAERAKYERERAKYEVGYKKERDVLVWKAYRLGDLFEFNSSNQLSLNKKALDISDIKIDDYKIALVTQSEKNNGISGYIKETEEISKKKMKNFITYSMHFGLCYYHDYDFVLMDTHGSVFRLLPKIQTLSSILENRKDINYFISFIIKKVCHSDLFSYGYLPNSSRASREIILLPCLEVTKDDDYIWEENGHYYTLAVEYISYMYLSGRVEFNQRLIDKYEYKY